MSNQDNPKSILICGESGHGKSASLMDIADRSDVLYFNCENGKPLPFKNNFKKVIITDPVDILDYLKELEALGDQNPYKIVIIDTVSFMMDLFETNYVLDAANTQSAWGDYGQFFPALMVQTAKVDAFFIFLGHLQSELDDKGIYRFSVPVKGALKTKGIEARFTTVLYVRKMLVRDIREGIKELGDIEENKLLNIKPKEEQKGFKHVFLTDSDKSTVGGRIRTPLGMFKDEELYIDNSVLPVLKRLIEYYE